MSGEREISLEYMRKGKVVTTSINPGEVNQELRYSRLPQGDKVARRMAPSKTNTVRLNRAVLKGILKGDTLKDVRGVTYMKGGRQLGVRIFAMKQGSDLKKLGLRNGDILLTRNGKDSITDWSTAFDDISIEAPFTIELMRNKEVIVLHVEADTTN